MSCIASMKRAVGAALGAALLGFTTPAAQAEVTNVREVHAALEAGRYREVEDFYEKLRKERTRTVGGEFLFEQLFNNIYWYSSTDPKDPDHWPKVDAATRAWRANSPKSHLAAMSRAFVLSYHAQAILVRGAAWGEVDRMAAEAARLMDESRADGKSDALWHATRLRVASIQGLPRTEVVNLIHAAVAADPYPLRLWLEASIALSPDGRNTDDLLWLMRLARQRTSGQEGASMAARVLGATYWHFGGFLASPFRRTDLDWKELHSSFLDWKQRYPGGYFPDLHGAIACAAEDRAATAAIITELGERLKPGSWDRLGGRDYAVRCKEWATAAARPKT